MLVSNYPGTQSCKWMGRRNNKGKSTDLTVFKMKTFYCIKDIKAKMKWKTNGKKMYNYTNKD